jgi:hypothetical protein
MSGTRADGARSAAAFHIRPAHCVTILSVCASLRCETANADGWRGRRTIFVWSDGLCHRPARTTAGHVHSQPYLSARNDRRDGALERVPGAQPLALDLRVRRCDGPRSLPPGSW